MLTIDSGPFTVRVRSPFSSVTDLLRWSYGTNPVNHASEIIDFNVRIGTGSPWRRVWRPQARFFIENIEPFEPYPASHAFPLLEWGLNWCIAMRAHQYLMLHSAVLERDGHALILPAVPGAGKSTLSAALSLRGWRFLSDEFGLVEQETGRIQPLPRAVPLKNASIDVIRAFAPEAEIGPTFEKTRKGTVAHLRPPVDSLARQAETAEPTWIVFPRYIPNAPVRINPLGQSVAFTRLAQNSFNYRLLGATGFTQLSKLIRDCKVFSAEYGDLDGVVEALDRVTGTSAQAPA